MEKPKKEYEDIPGTTVFDNIRRGLFEDYLFRHNDVRGARMSSLHNHEADSIRAAGSDQPGLIELVVAPVMTPSGQRVQVDILDTGLGLAEDQVGNVFDPFYTTKEPGQGTGLGLSVSHAIITAMGGTISLANREGGGATLTIVLPAAGQTAVPQDLGAIGPPCQEHPDAR